MARSKSSKRWLQEHHDDAYVRRAREQGYRSRAVFKLIELQQKDRLFRPGQWVLDLGAAPGGWSEYAMQLVGDDGRVIALDLLEMEPIAGVEFLRGDFTEQATLEALLLLIGDRKLDLVLSDMAPNLSGVESVDQPRAIYLAELALDLARQFLTPAGALEWPPSIGIGGKPLGDEIPDDRVQRHAAVAAAYLDILDSHPRLRLWIYDNRPRIDFDYQRLLTTLLSFKPKE